MTSFQYARIHFVRNWRRNLIIVFIVALILLTEMLCFCLSSSAEKGEQDAFRYNGSAFLIDIDSEHVLTDALRDAITEIDHVTGLSCSATYTMTASNLERSEEHTGYTLEETEITRAHANQFTLLADVDVAMSKWFWKEENVFLVEGVFPDEENQGLLIESRIAEENNISCGDTVEFQLDGNQGVFSLPVCGIYMVDSDFELADPQEHDYESEDEAFDPYDYSPYNRIYASYDAIASFTKEPIGQDGAAYVFVDSYDSIETVAPQLKELVGEEYALYDQGSMFLEEYGVLTLVRYLSQIIAGLAAITGIILILIIMTYFAFHFNYECGLMILMGQTRRSILGKYLIIVLLLVLGAGALALLLYFLIGPQLIQSIVDAANAYAQGNNAASSDSYYTVSLYQPFSMTASIWDLFSVNTLLAFFGVSCGLLVGTAIIPIWCVFRANPRRLFE